MLTGSIFSPIDFPGTSITRATGINDTGQLVGSYQDASLIYHSFLYDGVSFSTIDVPGATETVVDDINDSGQIVGWYRDASGQHGFVGTIVPEPISSILFLTGGAILAGRRYWRKKRNA